MANSSDPEELKDLWVGWHSISAPMRERYARFVELSNQGAREMGFKDTGAHVARGIRHDARRFSAELERLWEQVRPLYDSLHAYVRAKAGRRSTGRSVPPDGPIPAHLLGKSVGAGLGQHLSHARAAGRAAAATTSPSC